MAYRKSDNEGSNNCYARQRRIEEHLRSRRHPVSLSELAQLTGRSVRTIRRDLEALEAAGHIIERSVDYNGETDGERSLVRMVSRAFVSVALTRGEAHLLAGARRLFANFEGTCLHQDMERIFTKITEALPKAEREAIHGDAQRFYFVPDAGRRDYRAKADHIHSLQRAVVDRRRVTYRYRALSGQYFSGTMEPHAFIVYRNALYVLARRLPSARAQRNGDTHTIEWVRWPADRFVSVKVLPEAFTVAPDFNIEAHFDDFGILREERAQSIVVDFAPTIAAFITERTWHANQTVEVLSDGWVRLTFSTTNLKEVQGWIQSFGGLAVVRSPSSLRDAVLLQFKNALALADDRPPLPCGAIEDVQASAALTPAANRAFDDESAASGNDDSLDGDNR